ncbi:MAG: hypothetical protein ACR2GR_08855 [Rhodothermales bacterium]
MADQPSAKTSKPNPEEPTHSNGAHTSEAAAAYEDAKNELLDAAAKLRAEVEKFDLEQAQQRARGWVEENPLLAASLAAGAGILVGRVVIKAVTPAPPPPLPVRARNRARALTAQSRHAIHDAGDTISDRAEDLSKAIALGTAAAVAALAKGAKEAGETLSEGASTLGETVADYASDFSETVSDYASDLGGTLSHGTETARKSVAKRSSSAAHTIQDRAEHIGSRVNKAAHRAERKTGKAISQAERKASKASKTVQKKAEHGFSVAETLAGAAKTALTALLVKKASTWVRKAF